MHYPAIVEHLKALSEYPDDEPAWVDADYLAAYDEGRTFTEGDWDVAQRVVSDLPELVRRERLRSGLSIRTAATQIGMAFTTLDRIERRQMDPSRKTVIAVLAWLQSLPPIHEHVLDGDCWCSPQVVTFDPEPSDAGGAS